MTEKLIDRLVKFGFTLYEARVYVSLISIRVGSARDIQELTGIPRGRVYDVLESLVQKGYAGVTKGTPTLYSATDVQETFDRLKIDHSRMCDSLAADLIKIEQKVTAKTLTFQSYELHTEWALENQIQSLFRRCRSEMVVLSTNPQTIQKYETDLKKLAKRVQLYVIVDDPARFTGVSLKLYTGDQDIDTIFLGTKAPDGITDRVPDLRQGSHCTPQPPATRHLFPPGPSHLPSPDRYGSLPSAAAPPDNYLSPDKGKSRRLLQKAAGAPGVITDFFFSFSVLSSLSLNPIEILKDRLSSLLSCCHYDQSNRATHEEDTCDREDHSTHTTGCRELEAFVFIICIIDVKR